MSADLHSQRFLGPLTNVMSRSQKVTRGENDTSEEGVAGT
jgi:hypothetical protein